MSVVPIFYTNFYIILGFVPLVEYCLLAGKLAKTTISRLETGQADFESGHFHQGSMQKAPAELRQSP